MLATSDKSIGFEFFGRENTTLSSFLVKPDSDTTQVWKSINVATHADTMLETFFAKVNASDEEAHKDDEVKENDEDNEEEENDEANEDSEGDEDSESDEDAKHDQGSEDDEHDDAEENTNNT
jgi:hypothetical protein